MVRSDVAAGDTRMTMIREGGAERIVKIMSLTASRDVQVIQQVIKQRYGFLPSPDYCADLIDFVEELTDGQRG